MFDPKTLKQGDVVEAFQGSGCATARVKVVSVDVKDEKVDVVSLDQNGRVSNFEGGFYPFKHVLGLVDGGPLPEKYRSDWDRYFMDIATVAASRATCDRKHVGSVIVRDKTLLSTGYNGSIRGVESCRERGHMMEDGHCVRTVHAEANAIVQAAKNGVNIDNAELYTTASPCWWCFKLIANGGIKRVVFGEMYRDQRIFAMAERSMIKVDILYPPGLCEKCGKGPDERHDHN
jgi:dCMP deaminase